MSNFHAMKVMCWSILFPATEQSPKQLVDALQSMQWTSLLQRHKHKSKGFTWVRVEGLDLPVPLYVPEV